MVDKVSLYSLLWCLLSFLSPRAAEADGHGCLLDHVVALAALAWWQEQMEGETVGTPRRWGQQVQARREVVLDGGQQVDMFCWRRLVYPLLYVCVCVWYCIFHGPVGKHACPYRHTAAKMNSITSHATEGPTLCSLHSGDKKEKQRYIYLYLSICL